MKLLVDGESLPLFERWYVRIFFAPLPHTHVIVMAVKILQKRRPRVAQQYVLLVVSTVARRLDLTEGVRLDVIRLEDTTGRRIDRGYLRVDCFNVFASLSVHVDARLDVALASEFLELLVRVEAELADFLVGMRVVVGWREARRLDTQTIVCCWPIMIYSA